MLGICLILAGVCGGQATEGFSDVPRNHWAYAAVTDLKAKGILNGYPPEPERRAAPPIERRLAPSRKTHRRGVRRK